MNASNCKGLAGVKCLCQVIHLTPVPRMTICRLENTGDFPKQSRFGPRAVAPTTAEALKWIE